MPTEKPEANTHGGGPREGPAAADPYTEILDLARRASSRHAFLAKALACIGRHFDSPYVALYAHCQSELLQEELHFGPTDPGFWAPAVQEFLTRSLIEDRSRAQLLSAKHANLKIALLSAPLCNDPAGVSGAVAVVVRGGKAEAHASLPVLNALVALAASAAGTVGGAADDRSPSATPVLGRVFARAAAASSPEELAFALTNGVRAKLRCEQVALGLVSGQHVGILSISGLDDVNRRSPGVSQLRAAMEECLDLDQPVVCQQDGGWADEGLGSGCRLHQQWRSSAAGAAVASIPLHAGGRCAAILSLRRQADQPFDRAQTAEAGKLVEPFASALLLVVRARRGLFRHARESARDAARALVGPGRAGTKILTVLTVLAGAWFCFGTLDHQITVPAKLVPAQRRHVAAPFEAALASAAVSAGDLVRAGDVLCRFDQRELQLQQDQLRAQLVVLEHERTRALAADQPVEAKLVEARQRLAQVQLGIVDRRVEQATLRAPFDGMIISGDLRKQIGSVLAQGVPLFEIAPLDHWLLELEIPQNAAAELRVGLRGRFASRARPEALQPFELARVRPSAEIRHTKNIYVAEANVELNADWMRPGMEGVAKVYVGPRKVWWVALHSLLDYLRLNFWI